MLSTLHDYLKNILGKDLVDSSIHYDELEIVVDLQKIVKVLSFLKSDQKCLFVQMIDLCGVDHLTRSPRFDVVYHLLSLKHNMRIRVIVHVDDGDSVPSIVGVYSAAGWFEREAWDLYGIPFSGNPDMRRILTDYGFEGHPLRKDFPLTGFQEVRYDETLKRVVYDPVHLLQEFRNFDYTSPWDGMNHLLPGDEKAAEE